MSDKNIEKLYFGGKQNINAVGIQKVKLDQYPSKVVLDKVVLTEVVPTIFLV